MSPLLYIILFPFLTALALVFVPVAWRVLVRGLALVGSFLTLLAALKMFAQFQVGLPGYQLESDWVWNQALDIHFHLGVDGLNAGLILMGAVVSFAAVCICWEIQRREKEFYILLLVMTGGILGAFAALDLFFFYFFHELALVPTFIMIGVWGRGEQKNYATFQITLYLSLGALLALVGLVALYVQSGAQTFDFVKLTRHLQDHPLSAKDQLFIFPWLLFGFGILVSLWPFHTWAPLGYASAPTATAMVHAGVLKKFGLYGLMRIALPLLPAGAQRWMPVVAWLCLGNILYCGLVAMRQKDLNRLLGNSSVAHVGFGFLGLASLSILGVTGATVVMVAHGFLAALSFGLSGYLYQQTATLEIAQLGGLLRRLPFIGTALIMAMLAGCGLPGFANFIGEALVLFGAWPSLTWVTVLALWGALVIAAVYMLRAIRNMLHGPLPEKWSSVIDADNAWRRLPYVLLLGCLIVFGCVPRLLTDRVKPVAIQITNGATGRLAGTPLGSRDQPAEHVISFAPFLLARSPLPHPSPLPLGEGALSATPSPRGACGLFGGSRGMLSLPAGEGWGEGEAVIQTPGIDRVSASFDRSGTEPP